MYDTISTWGYKIASSFLHIFQLVVGVISFLLLSSFSFTRPPTFIFPSIDLIILLVSSIITLNFGCAMESSGEPLKVQMPGPTPEILTGLRMS